VSKNKSIYGTSGLLLGAALIGGYILYKSATSPKEGSPGGSLGGTDDLLEQQGFNEDPSAIPQQSYFTPNDQPQYDPGYYIITPEGQVVPQGTQGAGTEGGVGLPANVPIASTGTGSLFQDASAVGGALGANIFLPSVAKRINKLVDTKYIADALPKVEESAFKKFVKDPYNINDLSVSKAEKAGTREIAELGIDKTGKTVLKTVPKWASVTKTVANFIPLADIPIGAGLDVYFSKYEEDPNKKIDWWSAIKANTAGELAQLGVTAGAAASASVVPVAGTLAGGVGGFVVGTSADIATTELYYKQAGKTSLFSTSTPAKVEPAVQQSPSSSSSSARSKVNQVFYSNPLNTSSKPSTASVKTSTPAPSPAPTAKATSIVNQVFYSNPFNTSKAPAQTVSTPAKSTPAVAPKVSVVSKISSAVSNLFGGSKKKK
jgi:hypothetical protein